MVNNRARPEIAMSDTDHPRGSLSPEVFEDKLLGLNFGYAPAAVLDAALELEVFEDLCRRPASAEVLAKRNGWSADATVRLTAALVEIGLLQQDSRGKELVPAVSQSEASSFASLARHLRAVYERRHAWDDLAGIVRGAPRAGDLGDLSARARYRSFFLRGGEALLTAARGVAAIQSHFEARAVVVLYAGGGEWVEAQAERDGVERVYAVDSPEFLDETRIRLGVGKFRSRVELVPSTSNPQVFRADADRVVIPPLLRLLDEKTATDVIRRAFECIRDDVELILVDLVKSHRPGDGGRQSLFNVSMLVNTSGGELRDESEYRQLIELADGEDVNVDRVGHLTVFRARRRER